MQRYFKGLRVYHGRRQPGVDFINILHARFSYESKLSSFSLVTFNFAIFGAKILYEKYAFKMLMKLTPGTCVLSVFHLNLILLRLCHKGRQNLPLGRLKYGIYFFKSISYRILGTFELKIYIFNYLKIPSNLRKYKSRWFGKKLLPKLFGDCKNANSIFYDAKNKPVRLIRNLLWYLPCLSHCRTSLL